MPAERRKSALSGSAGAIGDRIRSVRAALSLKQVDFAGALGISQGSLSDVETGRYPPNLDALFGLARAFPFIDLRWLLSGEGSMYVSHVGLGLTDGEAMVVALRIAIPKYLERVRRQRGLAFKDKRRAWGGRAPYHWLARYLLLLYERYLGAYRELREKGTPDQVARLGAADRCAQLAAELDEIADADAAE